MEWGSDNSLAIRTVSEEMTAQIASYYRKAVKSNVGDIAGILNSIKAFHYHRRQVWGSGGGAAPPGLGLRGS